MKFRFNTVGFFTKDLPKMVAFYRDVFRFTTDWNDKEPNVEMLCGEMRLIMYPRELFEQMTAHSFDYPHALNGTMELSLDVENFAAVDDSYLSALRQGAMSVLEPITEPWGQRTCYVADPDGNLIEISSFVSD